MLDRYRATTSGLPLLVSPAGKEISNVVTAFEDRARHCSFGRLRAPRYLASGLVVLAFCMKDIIPLRVVALTSNIAFLTYGIGLGLAPVWLLHAILLPINCWRLWQGISRRHAVVPVRGNGQPAHSAPDSAAIRRGAISTR